MRTIILESLSMVLKPDKKATAELYGKPLAASDILIAQGVQPEVAQSFVRTAT